MSLSVPVKPKFSTIWSFTDSQMGVLTCMVASPGGTRMIIGSKNNNAVFFNPSTGQYQGTLSFEDQFFVKAAVWYSENHLIVGCSNGSLYYLCLSPSLKGFAATMCSILTERFPHQIRALAINVGENTLAIGYGTTVALLNRERVAGSGTWELTQRIPGSVDDKSGLVASLLYFPGPSNRLSLLVLYTESGFGVWKAPGDFNAIPTSSETCRVGGGSITPDGGTLAISTLDQTLVTYSLDENGPLLARKREYANPEHVSQSPVVPVGITEDGIAFGGTAKGQVVVISTHEKQDCTTIHHEDKNHVIRMISILTDRVVIGSTDPSTNTSVIKCYSLRNTEGRVQAIIKRGANGFQITVSEAILGWREIDCAWPTSARANEVKVAKPGVQEKLNDDSNAKKKRALRLQIRITGRAAIAMGVGFLVMVLVVTPPNTEPFNQRRAGPEETAVLKPTMERHNYWILYGMRYSAHYVQYQVIHWTTELLNVTFAILVFLITLLPETFRFIGKFIAKLICESDKEYREGGVCPRFIY